MIETRNTFEGDTRLPTPPAVAMRILQTLKQKEASSDELTRIISSDPALVSKILRVANSSLFGSPNRVDSIKRALIILGNDLLKNIALCFVIAKELRGDGKGGFDFDLFWKRSLTAAVCADAIASMLGVNNDDIFVTALLQDIGIAVMALQKPDEYIEVLRQKQTSALSTSEAEIKVFGRDHQEVGAELLRQWGLPETIYLPVRCHHDSTSVPSQDRIRCEILALSGKFSSVFHGARKMEHYGEVKEILCKNYRIKEEEVAGMVDAVAEKCIEVFSYFDLESGNMRPFSEILQEANEELGKLNLSYQHLVMELKQSKEQSEKLNNNLKQSNEKLRRLAEQLRELAIKDNLTGLYNHAYFHDQLDREITRSLRYGKQFSLVMFDLDHFKRINDRYGHLVGDQVLRKIGLLLTQLARSADLVARCGGEEFAILLPETDLKGAATVAERVRRAVEEMIVTVKGMKVRVTISLGVTSWMPGLGAIDKNAIVAAADGALYHSKKNGRNRTTITVLDNKETSKTSAAGSAIADGEVYYSAVEQCS